MDFSLPIKTYDVVPWTSCMLKEYKKLKTTYFMIVSTIAMQIYNFLTGSEMIYRLFKEQRWKETMNGFQPLSLLASNGYLNYLSKIIVSFIPTNMNIKGIPGSWLKLDSIKPSKIWI